MPASAIDIAHLSPFVAPAILESDGNLAGQALLECLVKEARQQANRSSSRVRQVLRATEIDTYGELQTQALIYREKGPPSWLSGVGVEDALHKLIVISVRGKLATLSCSDGAMRDRIVKNSNVTRRISREAVASFVGEEAKALWLNGIHTPTAAKADTKAITGPSLASSIDPIGDQSYYYSAARTLPSIPGLVAPSGAELLVGAAPGGGRVWLRRAESLDDYRGLISAVLDWVEGDHKPLDVFASLAKPVLSPHGISEPYALTVFPEELLSEDEIDNARREELLRWAFDADYEVAASDGLSLTIKPHLLGEVLGTISLLVSLADGVVDIEGTWLARTQGREEECASLAQFLTNPEAIKIYYDTGHTIAQGRCYSGGFVDQPFDWKFADFANYNVKQEKPVVPKGGSLAERIATNGDNSLFAYVVEKMFCNEAGNPEGWLASDDGSMELADFIHLDPDEKIITLVHVKASKRDEPGRQAAPSNYEIVVSQAVKNLRHLDRRNLHDELEKGKASKIGAAVWHNGVKQPNRDGFLKAAKKMPASAQKHLVVLQPNVTKQEKERCWGPDATPNQAMRIKQIDTLLLAARASALSCGASFAAWGATYPDAD